MDAVLEGPRLRLRLLAAGDGDLYARLYGDPATMRFVQAAGDAARLARGFAAACRLNRSLPPRRRFWVLLSRSPARPLGLIGLHWDAAADAQGRQGAELGVMLPPEEQDRGWASEAIALLQRHAFAALGLDFLHTAHAPEHALAAGLMRRCGFRRLADGDDGRWRWRRDRDGVDIG